MRTIIDTTAGAGESLKSGGDKINAMTAELYPAALAGSNAAGGRRPTVAVLGDSYGQHLLAAVQWACARHYPADIDLDSRAQADGGRLFSVGGTGSDHMLSTQLPQYLANPADIALIWTHYNSAPTSLSAAAGEFSNTRQTVEAILNAGAQMVVIMGFGAKANSFAGLGQAVSSLNTLLRNYARGNDRIVFVETQDLILDISTATSATLPFRTGTAYDGVHPSGSWLREALAPRLAQVLSKVAGRRLPRNGGARGGDFHPANAPDVNLFGDAGLMLGTGSTADGWFPYSYSSEVTITPSIITRPDGFKAQRLTFSGTTGSGGGLAIFQRQPTTAAINGGNAARLYDMEMLLDFNSVTGLAQLYLEGIGAPTRDAVAGTTAADQFPANYTAQGVFLYGLSAYTAANTNPELRATFRFGPSVAVSGSIDFYRADARRVAP